MKKFLFVMPLSLILVASCQKEIPTKLSGYFYTTDSSASELPLRLFFDGKEIGNLPYINQSIETLGSIDSAFKSKTLPFAFMSGKHFIQAKTIKDSVVASAEFSFIFKKNKSEMSTTSPVGASGGFFIDKDKEAAIYLSSTLKR
jgi:hypothetical protein